MTDEELVLFDNTVDLLRALVGPDKRRTGLRKQLSTAMGCQATYLSQVLKGKANLSLEQALNLAKHLGWSESITDFFLLLVQKSRAGTRGLENHFHEKIQVFRAQRTKIENRVANNRSLSGDQKNQYYSSWLYSAIHIALSIPQLQSEEAILSHFCAPAGEIRKILNFLETTNLLKREGSKISIGPTHIHLGKDSDLLNKHLTHWRIRAINSIDTQLKEEVHYSVVMSLSKADVLKCQEIMIQAIEKCNSIVSKSPEETLYCQNIDFFKV